MFCSKCGQEQASDAVSFCSRCGFKLNSPEVGLAKSLLKMAMFLVITIFAIIGWGSVTSGPGYGQVRVFVTLIAAISFYLLFWHDVQRIFHKLFSQNIERIKRVTPGARESALPPAQSIPVPALGSHRVDTAEMVQPPSVTERTTVLLDKNRG